MSTSSSQLWVEEHQDITIVCKATGKPTPTITWSEADGAPNSNSKSNGGQLTLSRVTPYEDGKYICKAKNELNAPQTKVILTVVPLLRFIISPPMYVKSLHKYKLLPALGRGTSRYYYCLQSYRKTYSDYHLERS